MAETKVPGRAHTWTPPRLRPWMISRLCLQASCCFCQTQCKRYFSACHFEWCHLEHSQANTDMPWMFWNQHLVFCCRLHWYAIFISSLSFFFFFLEATKLPYHYFWSLSYTWHTWLLIANCFTLISAFILHCCHIFLPGLIKALIFFNHTCLWVTY